MNQNENKTQNAIQAPGSGAAGPTAEASLEARLARLEQKLSEQMAENTVLRKMVGTTSPDPLSQGPRNVRIKLLTACIIGGEIKEQGQEVLATAAEAAEYCDRKFKHHFSHSGELLSDNVTHFMTVRAVRVDAASGAAAAR